MYFATELKWFTSMMLPKGGSGLLPGSQAHGLSLSRTDSSAQVIMQMLKSTR